MKRGVWAFVAAVVMGTVGASGAGAASVGGTYSTWTTGANAHATGSGPWSLYNVLAGNGDAAGVEFDLTTPVAFNQLTSFSADYNSLAASQPGSPRLDVFFTNGDYMFIYLGNPNGTAGDLNANSGQNFIGTTGPAADTYRYDLSPIVGHYQTTDYTGANAVVGTFLVKEVDLLADTGVYKLNVTSINLETASAPVPVPAAAWGGMVLLGGVAVAKRRKSAVMPA